MECFVRPRPMGSVSCSRWLQDTICITIPTPSYFDTRNAAITICGLTHVGREYDCRVSEQRNYPESTFEHSWVLFPPLLHSKTSVVMCCLSVCWRVSMFLTKVVTAVVGQVHLSRVWMLTYLDYWWILPSPLEACQTNGNGSTNACILSFMVSAWHLLGKQSMVLQALHKVLGHRESLTAQNVRFWWFQTDDKAAVLQLALME